jgi:hypothetical protein
MMRAYSFCCLFLLGAYLCAQQNANRPEPNRVLRFSKDDLDSKEAILIDKGKKEPRPDVLMMDVPTHRLSLVHRSRTDEPEMHTLVTDVWMIKSGSGTVLIGGEMVNKRPSTGLGNFRADSLRGAQSYSAKAGDIFNLPPNVPHGVILAPGETITYYNLKVRETALTPR